MNDRAAFKKWNRILGWVVFAIALATYALTMERTASLWDCGEFISGAYKLQVVHPPGAPFFLILGRIFSLFAFGNEQLVGAMVNLMSATSTAFVALFGFWSITMLAGKILLRTDDDYTTPNILTTLGAGLVGGLSITFLDSLWFSATEGEVYALSMFFMTFVLWATLKWDAASGPHRDRWILSIFFAVGLSLGVHLLSMLVIPFFGLVYYFNKYRKPNVLGAAVAIGASFVVIGVIMKGIISGVPAIFATVDKFMVNGLGMPFNTGVVLVSVVISAALAAAIWWAHTNRRHDLHVALLSLLFVLVGYTSFLMVPIRAEANPPINMNDPSDPFRMLSYLNREQYGVRPLIYGPAYNVNQTDDLKRENGVPVQKGVKAKYAKDEEAGQYVQVGERGEYVWRDDVSMFFPRLGFHSESGKIAAYRYWINPPYEVVDRQTRSVVTSFGPGERKQARAYVDQLNMESPGRYRVRDKLTWGDNIRFFFDYQLGYMYGRYLMWNFSGRLDDKQGTYANHHGGWISGIPFVDDHMPILKDLWGNAAWPQTQLSEHRRNEPARNRFFMIPFILGIVGLVFHFKHHWKAATVVTVAFLATGMIYLVYANEPPIEPRERDYVLAGSFFMYCFWIGMSVLALFTGLRKVLPGTMGAGLAIALGLVAPVLMGTQGWDDHDRSGRTTTVDFAQNYLESCEPNAIIFTQGDNDTYPLWYAQEVEGIRTDVRVVNLSLLGVDWYIDHLRYKMNDADPVKLTFTPDQIRASNRDYIRYMQNSQLDGSQYYDLGSIMEFIARDDKNVEKQIGYPYYLPTKKLSIAVDPTAPAVASSIGAERRDEVVSKMRFKLKKNNLLKNDLICLDIVANNINERPIYFAVSVSPGSYLGLQEFFQQEGLTYRIVPLKNPSGDPQQSPIHLDRMYDVVMNKWAFGGIDENPGVLMDENTQRLALNVISNFAKLSDALVAAGRDDDAIAVMDRCLEELPPETAGFSFFHANLPVNYFKAGAPDKARAFAERLRAYCVDELDYLVHAYEYEYRNSSAGRKQGLAQGEFLQYQAVREPLFILSILSRDLDRFDAELAGEFKTLVDDYQARLTARL